jgi:hypothetical protein
MAVGIGRAGRSVRTDHGGDENDGGEENVSLHVESFVREKELLNYLCGVNMVILCATLQTENDVTSRHTKSSSGSVVNMFSPKQNRAMLIRVSFSGTFGSITQEPEGTRWLTGEKLLSMLPCVRSVKTTYPDIAITEHAMSDTTVDTCVTVANRLRVGVLRLP